MKGSFKKSHELGFMRGIHFQKHTAASLALCCSIGLPDVIYFVRCKDKSPLVLFDTSAIFVWGEGLLENKRLGHFLAHTCSSSSAAAAQQQQQQQLVALTGYVSIFTSSRRCFFFFFFFFSPLSECKVNQSCNKGGKKDTR